MLDSVGFSPSSGCSEPCHTRGKLQLCVLETAPLCSRGWAELPVQAAGTQFQPGTAGGLPWDVLPMFGLPWEGAGSVDLSQQVALTISYPLLTLSRDLL